MSDERPEDQSGDAADDDTVSMQAITPEVSGPEPARSGSSLFPVIAHSAALVALALSGLLYWQSRQSQQSLEALDERTRSAISDASSATRAADDALSRLGQAVDGNARSLSALEDRMASIPEQLADMRTRIDTIQGGSFDTRQQWLVAEAAYYLGVANSELQLGGRWENALAALRLADDRLRETGDPGLAAVREQIADEILALDSIRLADVEGLAHSLARLSSRVTMLPLRSTGEDAGDRQLDQANEQEAGLGRLWSSVKEAFSSIVRVERRDEPALVELTAQEQRLIRRQLSVELQTARLALLSDEPGVFRASLEQAASLLREDFDAEASDVEGGLRLVESLLELDVAPETPDISRSLAMLRARGAP